MATTVRTLQNFIDGEWVESTGESAREIASPVTEEKLAEAPSASRDDLDRAVASARAAQPRWAALSAWERARVCHAIADLIDERREDFARELALEQGKPYKAEALPDIDETAENFRVAAEDVKRMESAIVPSQDVNKRILTFRVANGVYYQPTVVDNVGVDTLINRDETFGPIVPVIRVRDDDEAIAVANDSYLGLQSAVYTRSLKRAFRYSDLRTGNVVVNDSTDYYRAPEGRATTMRSRL